MRRPRARPWLAFSVASVALLLLSGCVYLRLLQLKKQLGDFNRHFSVQTSDGVIIMCQEPLLRTKDVRWMGLRPEQVKTLGLAEQWQVRWVKQLPLGVIEPEKFDIVVELGFGDDKLTRIAIPEHYFTAMPKEFLVGVIKSVGGGRIDKSKKNIAASVSAEEVAAARPKLPGIDRLLGRPSEERTEGPYSVLRYQYIPATTESRAGVFDMHLTFETESGELLRWQGKTPIGEIEFNFAEERASSQ